jgi:hypothetical protein
MSISRIPLALLAVCCLSKPAVAAELSLQIEIPRLNVAEYHRPYLAIWLEDEQRRATNLAVWYDLKMKDAEGTKWLKDLRQWWRKSGRSLELPIDGMTSATRAPGKHRMAFSSEKTPLNTLPAGQYRLFIEAAREVGGREVVSMPFAWPPRQSITDTLTGKEELAEIVLRLTP